MRRWHAEDEVALGGIRGIVREGVKFPGDLVLQLQVPCRYDRHVFVPRFELVYAMADFFAENEDARANYEDGWRFNGDTYFMKALGEAMKSGWEGAAQRVREQRAARAYR